MSENKKIGLDLDEIMEEAIEITLSKGLNEDKDELELDYDKDTFYETQMNYRMYGALFGMNLKENLKELITNKFNEERED